MLNFPVKSKAKAAYSSHVQTSENLLVTFPSQPGSLQLWQQAPHRRTSLFKVLPDSPFCHSGTKEPPAVFAVEKNESKHVPFNPEQTSSVTCT